MLLIRMLHDSKSQRMFSSCGLSYFTVKPSSVLLCPRCSPRRVIYCMVLWEDSKDFTNLGNLCQLFSSGVQRMVVSVEIQMPHTQFQFWQIFFSSTRILDRWIRLVGKIDLVTLYTLREVLEGCMFWQGFHLHLYTKCGRLHIFLRGL